MIQRQRNRLGDVLVQKQVISPEDLQKALKEQKNRGTKLGETLMSMGLVSEQQMVEVLTEMLHIDYVELRNIKLDKEAVYLINETIAKQYNLIPIGFDKNNPNILMVAMSDPMDFIAMDDISIITNRRIQPVLSTSSQIAYEIDRYFGRQSVMEVAERYKKEFGEEEAPEDKNDKRDDEPDDKDETDEEREAREKAERETNGGETNAEKAARELREKAEREAREVDEQEQRFREQQAMRLRAQHRRCEIDFESLNY